MYNHEPKDYQCPLCGIAKGSNDQITKQSDVIYRNNTLTVFISGKWWPNNPGHVIIIPNKHIENIYDIPDTLLDNIYRMVKRVSIALKEVYICDGTSTRQHNEPSGNQDVWHFHVHVFPRYKNDRLYQNHDQKRWVTPEERIEYARKLKAYFAKQKI